MSSRFSITQAVVDGFGFAKREWRALARMSVLPLGAGIITQIAIGLETSNDLSPYAEFIYTLPALILSARFMFQVTRLRLLGEREENLPADPAYLAARQQALRASILLWLVVNAAATVIVGYFEWLSVVAGASVMQGAASGAPPVINESHFFYNIIGLLLMVCAIWGVRFAAGHLILAVEYPLAPYLRRVRGFGISLRLLGLSFLIAFPASFAFLGVIQLLAPDGKMPSPVPFAFFVVLNNIISFVCLSVLTAAACAALKEIMGRKDGGTSA
ncbi:MAG: hypothetical protein PW788_05345 [Micavibrio sp.]|nr:hypothetical protein [Micavibrio sp.]